MPLRIGTHLGPYEIQSALGAGGMGEVYRARDTKLNRDVALKVLPEIFAADPDRLARFKREAQVLASLNHPNIAAIYGLEEADGVRALVLELVEGPTLADRIAQGGRGGPEGPPLRQTGESAHRDRESGHRDRRGGPSGPPIPIDEALHRFPTAAASGRYRPPEATGPAGAGTGRSFSISRPTTP
jgi:serine/threonine protein kinase